MQKAAIAVFLAMSGMIYSDALLAASLAPIGTLAHGTSASMFTPAQGRSGAFGRSMGQLRTFRPSQIGRIRPLVEVNKVRPGRPHVRPHEIRPVHQAQLPHRKRPPRRHYIHVAEGVTPEAEPVSFQDHRRDHTPLSPDFCRYWGDRGEAAAFGEPCW
jgi:hypothetical protein